MQRHSLKILFLAAAFLFAAAYTHAAEHRPPEWARPVALENSDNFFRVTDALYRSAQPKKKAMRAYEKLGIRTVVNLQASDKDAEKADGTGLVLVHIPAKSQDINNTATIVKILQAIRDAEKPVLLHCKHGAHRTGFSIAMYRIVEQGWTKEAARSEMRDGGFGFRTKRKHLDEYIENLTPEDVEHIRAALR